MNTILHFSVTSCFTGLSLSRWARVDPFHLIYICSLNKGPFVYHKNILKLFLCFADTPLVEQFKIRGMKNRDGIQMAWLDNKIYVVHKGLERVRVYADEAPFNELQDEIKLEGLGNPMGLYANACSQLLLIGDDINDCFWKIQLPGKEVSRWDINDPPGRPLAMSITTDDELLAVIRHNPPYKAFVDNLRREFEEAEQTKKIDADENDKRVENDDVNGGAGNDDGNDDDDDDDDDDDEEETGNARIANKPAIPFPFPFPIDYVPEYSDSDSGSGSDSESESDEID